MKIYGVLILAIVVFAGCSSTDKKSTYQSQESSVDEARQSTEIDSTVVAKSFSPEADTSGLIHFSGQLNYTGNEPFATPALFVSGSKTVPLTGDSTFLKETFKTLNGKKATIYGKMKDMGIDTMLYVYYYELRESN